MAMGGEAGFAQRARATALRQHLFRFANVLLPFSPALISPLRVLLALCTNRPRGVPALLDLDPRKFSGCVTQVIYPLGKTAYWLNK